MRSGRIVFVYVSVLLLSSSGIAKAFQNTQKAAVPTEGASAEAPKQLQTQATINGKVEIHALLIPPKDVNHIFGRAIAERFAVIQTTVVNPSGDYNLLVQNISTDYSQWLLAGCLQEKKDKDDKEAATPSGNATRITQAVTQSCQVSSLELRAIRQVALQGQTDSTRNRWIRGLKTLASIGTGLTAAGGLGPVLPRAVDAFSGSAIPAFEFLFPDNTIAQVNLLNDLAYAANSLVPKDSSKVFMTFFPIDRFLGDYLGNYYRTTPALFYAPLQYYLDPKFNEFFDHVQDRLTKFVGYSLALTGPLHDVGLTVTPSNYKLSAGGLLNYLSLNSLRVIVDGKFVVDTTEVTPSISKITIDATEAKKFESAGTVTGSLSGQFLSGAKLAVADADTLGITVERTDAGTEDASLNFKLTLTKAIPYQTKLSLTVEKAGKSGTLTSAAGTYTVQALGQTDYPVLTGAQPASLPLGGAVTLTGSHFWNLSGDDHVKAVLRGTAAGSKPVTLSLDPDNIAATTITFNFPDNRSDLPVGVYNIAISYKSPIDGVITSADTTSITVTAKP